MNIQKQFQRHIPLAPYTTFHIGGPADYFFRASTEDALVTAVRFAQKEQMPFFLLGTGANILVGDKGFRGLVIKNETHSIFFTNTVVTVASGTVMADVIHQTMEHELSGLEHFSGIPSSVGGAIWQNLHFLSEDRKTTVFIADIIKSVKLITTEGKIQNVTADYFNFSYDYSILHDRQDVVLSVTFQLEKKTKESMQSVIQANLTWRDNKHPYRAREMSAGSVFKKIEGYGAGRLIEQVGLKGKRIGGALVSEKHANFIINDNNATATDVRQLIELIQETVKQKLGLSLTTEISFIGEF